VTIYSVWDPGRLGVVWTMFTDPPNRPINRPPEDHPRGRKVHLLLNPRVHVPSHFTFLLFTFVFGIKDFRLTPNTSDAGSISIADVHCSNDVDAMSTVDVDCFNDGSPMSMVDVRCLQSVGPEISDLAVKHEKQKPITIIKSSLQTLKLWAIR
jgi:hypothetical protein